MGESKGWWVGRNFECGDDGPSHTHMLRRHVPPQSQHVLVHSAHVRRDAHVILGVAQIGKVVGRDGTRLPQLDVGLGREQGLETLRELLAAEQVRVVAAMQG